VAQHRDAAHSVRPTEREKMLAGELYDPLDPELVSARARARDLCQALNATREADEAERRRILVDLFGAGGDNVWMQPPFFCDYGWNISVGQRVFFNFNCVVLDVCAVRIGDFSLFGPAVQIYTATHPLDAEQRRTREFAKPVRIGCLGRRRRDHLPWSDHRIARGDWRRQRRDTRHSGRRVRRRQPVPRRPAAVNQNRSDCGSQNGSSRPMSLKIRLISSGPGRRASGVRRLEYQATESFQS
jgi:maltose O-acetyltransferase